MMCDRWKNSLTDFLADMGHPPSDHHEIDRRDNDGPYSPDNCRWVTHKENMNNTSACVFLEYDGNRLTIAQWAERLGASTQAIHYRVKAGWAMEKIVNTAIRRCKH